MTGEMIRPAKTLIGPVGPCARIRHFPRSRPSCWRFDYGRWQTVH